MEEFVNFLQTWAFELAKLLLPIIAAFLVAALRALTKKWLAEMQEKQPRLMYYLKEAVSLAVKSAEQARAVGFIEDKKAQAMIIAQEYLDAHGWSEVNLDLLDSAIEAEVYRFNQERGLAP